MTDPTLTYHNDPGHGWLEVTLEGLTAVGLTKAAFSHYSYTSPRDGGRVYLEEDSDMNIFMEAYKARNGDYPKLAETHCHGDSFIRSLDSLPYSGPAPE